jgi:hypothetical protein
VAGQVEQKATRQLLERFLDASHGADELITLQPAAQALNVCVDTVRDRELTKEWPGKKIGKCWRVNLKEIQAKLDG